MWSLYYLKTSNQSLFVLELSEMSCCDGCIVSFAACKLQILRHPVPLPLSLGCVQFSSVFLDIVKLMKSYANKVE